MTGMYRKVPYNNTCLRLLSQLKYSDLKGAFFFTLVFKQFIRWTGPLVECYKIAKQSSKMFFFN